MLGDEVASGIGEEVSGNGGTESASGRGSAVESNEDRRWAGSGVFGSSLSKPNSFNQNSAERGTPSIGGRLNRSFREAE